MRLVYLSEAAIPSRSSNSMQTMRMAAAFAAAGAEATLLHPTKQAETPEGLGEDIEAFYGVPRSFERRVVPSLPAGLGRGGRLATLTAALLKRSRPGAEPFCLYTRSFVGLAAAAAVRRLYGRRTALRAVGFELHDLPPGERGARALAGTDCLYTISEALRADLERIHGIPRARVRVEHDGVDLAAVTPERLDRAAGRTALGLEGVTGPVVVYTGRAIKGKGADTLLRAAPRLEAIGARVFVVGRVYEDEYLALDRPNVTLTGFVPPSDVPPYLAVADVLVMPTTAELPYAAYTSPLKLFEYLASGRPVVSSDLPVIQEVVTHEENALLYPAGDPAGLAGAVERLWSEPELGKKLAARAWDDVQQYAWDRRAARIVTDLEEVAKT